MCGDLWVRAGDPLPLRYRTSGGELRTIVLATLVGPRSLEAEVFGDFAVTPGLEIGQEEVFAVYDHWTVTHVPTGRAMAGITVPDRRPCVLYAESLNRAIPPGSPPEVVRMRAQELCEAFLEAVRIGYGEVGDE